MSGFTASNSRIKVVETVGSVDETVFDTDDDMPHIVGVTYLTNVAVDFDALTETQNFTGTQCNPGYVTVWNPSTTTYDRDFTAGFVTTEYDWSTGLWTTVYVPSVWYMYSVYTPGFFSQQFDACATTSNVYEYSVDAEEYSSVVDLTNLPTDEDGNTVDVDFVIVQATGTRSTGGKDPRFNQALPTTVPSKTFSFQGSVLLESSGKANGDSWFRRIMSVYPSGSKLKLKIQESVATLVRGATNSAFPHIGQTRSTYSFNFKVFFGKFRQ